MDAYFERTDKQQYIVLALYINMGNMNEQNCDLLWIASNLTHTTPTSIIQTISVLHECADNCMILHNASIKAERSSNR